MPDSIIRKSPWPYALAASLGVVIVMNCVLVYLAASSDTGPIDRDPYEKGIAYETTIAAKRALSDKGWNVSVFTVDEAQGSLARVHVVDATGSAVEKLSVALRLLRPSDGTQDSSLTLTESTPGVYQAALPRMSKGLWLAEVRMSSGQNDFAYDTKIIH